MISAPFQKKSAVVGGGIFGLAGAIALARRGQAVTVFDPGPVPHPLAESTDISKIVRLDYGDDALYTELMERALARWRSWSASAYFHETGVLFLRRTPLEPGSFEGDSYALLTRRGHRLERLDAGEIARRYPAWNGARFVDGYFNAAGGYAESGNVVRATGSAAASPSSAGSASAPLPEPESRRPPAPNALPRVLRNARRAVGMVMV